MKTIFFKKNEPKEGYTSLVSKENTYLNDLEIGRLRLGKKGDKFSGHTKNHELLLEILIKWLIIIDHIHILLYIGYEIIYSSFVPHINYQIVK